MLVYNDLESHNMNTSLKDWRKALSAPTTYRIGNTVRIQSHFVMLVSLMGAVLLILFYYYSNLEANESVHKWAVATRHYNTTYPLSPPIVSGGIVTYRLGIVADLDTDSKVSMKPNIWQSFLLKGYLSYSQSTRSVVVTWDKQPPVTLSSSYSLKGRGMELSELVVFDGRLLTFDDRSGMVYEMVDNKVIPWLILMDGNGSSQKGFKSEWASVRGEVLYVGSMGKEWTTAAGKFESFDPMWIKAINMYGEVQHVNWVRNFKAIRSSIGVEWPGYMIHESGVWSQHAQRWYFLPRRCSKEQYNETKDEVMGCNYLISSDSKFSRVIAKKITESKPKHGFSSFKFIPGSEDQAIVALRTTEFEGKTATYIMAFTVDGEILMNETFVADIKYEGLEFI